MKNSAFEDFYCLPVKSNEKEFILKFKISNQIFVIEIHDTTTNIIYEKTITSDEFRKNECFKKCKDFKEGLTIIKNLKKKEKLTVKAEEETAVIEGGKLCLIFSSSEKPQPVCETNLSDDLGVIRKVIEKQKEEIKEIKTLLNEEYEVKSKLERENLLLSNKLKALEDKLTYIKYFDNKSIKIIKKINLTPNVISFVSMLSNDKFALCTLDGIILIEDIREYFSQENNLQKEIALVGHTKNVICVIEISPGKIVSYSEDETIKFWSINSALCIQSIKYSVESPEKTLLFYLNPKYFGLLSSEHLIIFTVNNPIHDIKKIEGDKYCHLLVTKDRKFFALSLWKGKTDRAKISFYNMESLEVFHSFEKEDIFFFGLMVEIDNQQILVETDKGILSLNMENFQSRMIFTMKKGVYSDFIVFAPNAIGFIEKEDNSTSKLILFDTESEKIIAQNLFGDENVFFLTKVCDNFFVLLEREFILLCTVIG